jgi:hypothetical protein
MAMSGPPRKWSLHPLWVTSLMCEVLHMALTLAAQLNLLSGMADVAALLMPSSSASGTDGSWKEDSVSLRESHNIYPSGS